MIARQGLELAGKPPARIACPKCLPFVERRRPGRLENVSPELLPLLRESELALINQERLADLEKGRLEPLEDRGLEPPDDGRLESRACAGLLSGLVLSVPLWAALIWLVNALIG